MAYELIIESTVTTKHLLNQQASQTQQYLTKLAILPNLPLASPKASRQMKPPQRQPANQTAPPNRRI
jgi:hypothetical protein